MKSFLDRHFSWKIKAYEIPIWNFRWANLTKFRLDSLSFFKINRARIYNFCLILNTFIFLIQKVHCTYCYAYFYGIWWNLFNFKRLLFILLFGMPLVQLISSLDFDSWEGDFFGFWVASKEYSKMSTRFSFLERHQFLSNHLDVILRTTYLQCFLHAWVL